MMVSWHQFGHVFGQEHSTELLTNGRWDATNLRYEVAS